MRSGPSCLRRRLRFVLIRKSSEFLTRLLPLDDRNARQEWGWEPMYTLEHMVEDFLDELRTHPQR